MPAIALRSSPISCALLGPDPVRTHRMHWELRGPWRRGQPIHETLTRLSLVRAAARSGAPSPSKPDIDEYVRGAVWNDDPDGFLFDERRFKWFGEPTTTKLSSGVLFAFHFLRAKRAGRSYGADEPVLLKRSHFGDLQFLHAMAGEGELPAVTHAAILEWAELTYGIATGRIPGTTPLEEVPVPGVAARFLPRVRRDAVERLFLISPRIKRVRGVDVRKRAAGSLLHLIHDSFAAGHTTRDASGAVLEFHSYERQDARRHALADRLGTSRSSATLAVRAVADPLANGAVDAGATALAVMERRGPWDEAREALVALIPVSSSARPAGPGTRFASRSI